MAKKMSEASVFYCSLFIGPLNGTALPNCLCYMDHQMSIIFTYRLSYSTYSPIFCLHAKADDMPAKMRKQMSTLS